ncbi:MAG TPA: hypothetical protein DEB25_03075 [Desulfobulbaceae bacterium]|nr:hypothetical protein [Desulfobulbaceae bacterium]
MHELSLMTALIEQLNALLDKHGAKRLTRVKLLAGPFSGVCADSLRFSYQALTANNPCYAGSLLEIETLSVPQAGGGDSDLILQQVELEEEA